VVRVISRSGSLQHGDEAIQVLRSGSPPVSDLRYPSEANTRLRGRFPRSGGLSWHRKLWSRPNLSLAA